MRTSKVIHVISCHAEGEVGDVIVGGVTPPPGNSVREQAQFIARDQELRNFVLNEPRGGVFRHVNLLVPPQHPEADVGWIVMEPEDTPPMSGSNSICVATVLVESGMVPMVEPETQLTLEAPGGLVRARVACRAGRAERVTVVNVASFAERLDANVEVAGLGTLTVDLAYGGDAFVLVDAGALGVRLTRDEARELAELGVRITRATNEQLQFDADGRTALRAVSFCQMTAPVADDAGTLSGLNAVAIRPAKLDRSPCGTGCSARMAVLHARGILKSGDRFIGRSVLGSRFDCRIESEVDLKGARAIIPSISGRAWITGVHQHMLDPADPWPQGYRLADTWPRPRG